MSWQHVTALMIACLMVVACVWIIFTGPQASGGREMFFGVVQLANTIASGVAGMAIGAGMVMKRRRDLTGHPEREKLGHPPKT